MRNTERCAGNTPGKLRRKPHGAPGPPSGGRPWCRGAAPDDAPGPTNGGAGNFSREGGPLTDALISS
eukprot:13964173-Alexandrium_andersonii.AAC.1